MAVQWNGNKMTSHSHHEADETVLGNMFLLNFASKMTIPRLLSAQTVMTRTASSSLNDRNNILRKQIHTELEQASKGLRTFGKPIPPDNKHTKRRLSYDVSRTQFLRQSDRCKIISPIARSLFVPGRTWMRAELHTYALLCNPTNCHSDPLININQHVPQETSRRFV